MEHMGGGARAKWTSHKDAMASELNTGGRNYVKLRLKMRKRA